MREYWFQETGLDTTPIVIEEASSRKDAYEQLRDYLVENKPGFTEKYTVKDARMDFEVVQVRKASPK